MESRLVELPASEPYRCVACPASRPADGPFVELSARTRDGVAYLCARHVAEVLYPLRLMQAEDFSAMPRELSAQAQTAQEQLAAERRELDERLGDGERAAARVAALEAELARREDELASLRENERVAGVELTRLREEIEELRRGHVPLQLVQENLEAIRLAAAAAPEQPEGPSVPEEPKPARNKKSAAVEAA